MTLVQGAWAQSPSTIGIIDPDGLPRASQGEPADFSSGRYQVRPRPSKKEKPLSEEYEKAQLPPKKKEEPKPLPAPKPEIEPPEEASTLPPQAPAALVPNAPVTIGGSPSEIDEFRSFLPPDDPRRNIVDLFVAPLFMYNDSNSPYWYRSYSGFSPGFTAAADVWFTPLFGFEGSYRKTVAGTIRESPVTSEDTPASQEWITAGLRFRRFFGFGERVPMLTVGVDYREYSFRVPSDDANRLRLKTVSPRILLETAIPTSSRYSWKFGLEVEPFARHQELDTGIDAQSGTSNETFGFGLNIGGEYRLARTSRMFYRLSYYLERTAFSGSASRPDPVTGTTPSNVPVNNSFTVFEFGYAWGQ
jgi:hypothetical protein